MTEFSRDQPDPSQTGPFSASPTPTPPARIWFAVPPAVEQKAADGDSVLARDLRFITTSLKIVKDLERVGDLAVDIAKIALELNQEPAMKPLRDYAIIGEAAQKMLKDALDAFVNEDAEMAQKVLYADDYVDMLNEKLFREMLTYMMENPANISRASNLMFVAKSLERVGDHASNVAEMVIFPVEGRDIRHLQKVANLKEVAEKTDPDKP